MRLVDNRSLTMADALRGALDGARSVRIAAAFISRSGLRLVQDPVQRLLCEGLPVEILFGLDMRVTQPEAIRDLIVQSRSHPSLSFFAFSDFRQVDVPVFHPKLYIIEGSSRYSVFIGSSNFTAGGLKSNNELNVAMTLSEGDSLLREVLEAYTRYRNHDSQFIPDEDYVRLYAKVYRAVRRGGREAFREPTTHHAIRDLKEREDRLPGPKRTQKGLIVLAIKALRSSQDDYIHHRDIHEWVRLEAVRTGLTYDWAALPDSLRGRINENVVGASSGEGLFIRKGGFSTRSGRYRLSDAGEDYAAR